MSQLVCLNFHLIQVDIDELASLRDAIVASGRNLHNPITSKKDQDGRSVRFSTNQDVNRSLAALLLSPQDAANMLIESGDLVGLDECMPGHYRLALKIATSGGDLCSVSGPEIG